MRLMTPSEIAATAQALTGAAIAAGIAIVVALLLHGEQLIGVRVRRRRHVALGSGEVALRLRQ